MTTVNLAHFSPPPTSLDSLLPAWTGDLGDLQTAIPELAKDCKRLVELDCVIGEVPTLHRSVHGDARNMAEIEPKSVHLAETASAMRSTIITFLLPVVVSRTKQVASFRMLAWRRSTYVERTSLKKWPPHQNQWVKTDSIRTDGVEGFVRFRNKGNVSFGKRASGASWALAFASWALAFASWALAFQFPLFNKRT